MNIYISGINYKTTPLEVREKLSFSAAEQRLMLAELGKLPFVDECIVLSTCNRTEVYIYSEGDGFEHAAVEKFLCDFKDLDLYGMKKYFYAYKGIKAVKHLLKVACGLDSLVVGEDQILGQVKAAHETAMEAGASAGVLNTLFRRAVTAAKKVKTHTELSKNPVSIGSLAVKLVMDRMGGKLDDKCALVIGAGKIGSIALKNLISMGIGRVMVTNRSHGRVESLSGGYDNMDVVDYNERYRVMDRCDIVISCTASPHYTITKDMLQKTAADGRERLLIDLAVPRDIDAAVRELEGVRYYNIDDLKDAADKNIGRKMAEAEKAESLIDEAVLEYAKWYEFRSVLPVVKEIQKYTEGVIDEKAGPVLSKLKCAGEEEKELIVAAMHGMVNEILNKFIYGVREYADKDDLETYFRCLKEAMKGNTEE